MIKFFQEEVEPEILSIKNRKSNLIMNLPLVPAEKLIDTYKEIVLLELNIAELEIKREFWEKAERNIDSAILYLQEIKDRKMNHLKTS